MENSDKIDNSGLGFDAIAGHMEEMFKVLQLKQVYEPMPKERFKEIAKILMDGIDKGITVKATFEGLIQQDDSADIKQLYDKFINLPEE